MFSAAERDLVRERLLELARSDPAVTGAAIIGSQASGGVDRWSDIDLAIGVSGEALALRLSPLLGELADGAAS